MTKAKLILAIVLLAGCDNPPPTCCKCGGPIESECYRIGYQIGRAGLSEAKVPIHCLKTEDMYRGMADGVKAQ